MAFTDTSKANYAFKALLGKAHTSTGREIANETLKSGVTAIASRVWADSIPLSGASAVAAGVAVLVSGLVLEVVSGAVLSSVQVSYRLKLPGAVPAGLVGKINPATGLVYASNDYVAGIIPEAYGIVGASDFRPILKENGGVEIPPLDSSDWFLDPFAGIVTREADGDSLSRVWTAPLTMDAYIYCGRMASDYNTLLVELISLTGALQTQKINDAPLDGQIYGRFNGTWTTISSGGASVTSPITVNNISAGSVTLVGAGGTVVSTDLITKIITISSSSTINAGNLGTILTGQIDVITGQDTFSVTHTSITGSSYPIVSLVVPNSAAPLYIQSISNTSTTGFNVILSGVVTQHGYKVNWQRASSGYINVVNGNISYYIPYDETISGSNDGININFSLSTTPIENSLLLFRNGVRLTVEDDYTISGSNIAFLSPPTSGSSLRSSYWAPPPAALADIAGHIAQSNPHTQYLLKDSPRIKTARITTTGGVTYLDSSAAIWIFSGSLPHTINMPQGVTDMLYYLKTRCTADISAHLYSGDVCEGSSADLVIVGGSNSRLFMCFDGTEWNLL